MLGWCCVIQVLDGLSSSTYFAKQVAYFKALGRDTQYLARGKELVATKGEKCLDTTYIEGGT